MAINGWTAQSVTFLKADHPKKGTIVSEYDEEDARERPAEDGLDALIPEDENLRVSGIQNFDDELEDAPPLRDHSE
jgi:hypothetical protein